jgi:hypothetical protein
LCGQYLIARIYPRRRAAKRQGQKTGSVFTRFDRNGRLGSGDFSLQIRSVRKREVHRAATDKRRRQCESAVCDQDGRTD